METISFVLGIAFVVVIGIAVVATYAFVKVLKTAKELEEFKRQSESTADSMWQSMGRNDNDVHGKIYQLERDISQVQSQDRREFQSQLDSRLDKLESKLMPTSAFKNKIN